jgi:multiple sugar transport system substrate-binding protein
MTDALRRPVSRRAFLRGGLTAAGAAVASPAVLAACASGGSGSGGSSGGTVTLTFWDTNAGPTRTPYLQELIKRFEASNPKIKVTYNGLPIDDVDEKLQAAIASGSVPDVTNGDMSYISGLVAQNGLIPLDSYLSSWSQYSDVDPVALASVRSLASNKQLYGLPYSNNLDVLYYRKDWFADAGLQPPTTWGNFFAAADALTDPKQSRFGFGMRGGSGSVQVLQSWIFAESGITSFFDASGKSTFDNPASVAVIKRAASMYGKQTSTGDLSQDYQQMVAEFDAGHAAMIFHSLGSYNQHMQALGADKFGALPMPALASGGHVLVGGRYELLQVFKGSAHPAEAFKFASYIASPASVSYWNQEIGQIPPNKAVYGAAWVKKNFAIEALVKTTDETNTVTITPPFYLPDYDALQTEMEPTFQKVLTGNQSAESFATTMAANYTTARQQYEQAAKKGTV